MKRWTFAALAAATLCAGAALAETPLAETPTPKDPQLARHQATHYASAAERWRGRPALKAALAHPLDQTSASEKVYEHVPAVNFMLEGQVGGAFATPSQ